MALFSPFYMAVAAGQFSLPIFACLIAALLPKTGAIVSGLCLALAMIKPSISLPFLTIAIVQARWKPLAIMSVIHCLAMLAVCVATRSWPQTLLSEWLSVSRYFLQGMNSIQEIINVFNWQNYGPALSGLVLLLSGGVTLLGWQAPLAYHIAFTGMVSMFWTYHGPYDFICVLPALMILMRFELPEETPAINRSARLIRLLGWGSFILLSLELTPAVYEGNLLAARLLRWGGRFAFILVLLTIAGLFLRQSRQCRVAAGIDKKV